MARDEHEELIRSAMAELTANFGAATPIDETLAAVTAAAVRLISGVDSADVLLVHDGEYQSTAAASEVAPTVDAAQQRTGEGPCLDAAGPDVLVRCDDLGAMLATHAAVALSAENRQHQFESALASRDVIGQAKGIVMERYDLDAVRAFELLARMSQNSNTPVSVIASEIAGRSGYRYR